MLRRVTTAVIPAAGLGTRMLPLTKLASKEMLPIGGRPMIDVIVQEAIDAGIERLCIVIREGKEEIRRYFEPSAQPSNKDNETDVRHALRRQSCEIVFAYQQRPLGLGDALLSARDFVGNEPFAMLIPDQLFFGDVAPVMQLTNKGLPSSSVISSLIFVPPTELQYFPGARGFVCEPVTGRSDVVVITDIKAAQSTVQHGETAGMISGFGRTVFPAEVFRFLGEDFVEPRTGEVDLFRTFKALLLGTQCFGVMLQGKVYDLGTLAGYQRFCSSHPQHAGNRE